MYFLIGRNRISDLKSVIVREHKAWNWISEVIQLGMAWSRLLLCKYAVGWGGWND